MDSIAKRTRRGRSRGIFNDDDVDDMGLGVDNTHNVNSDDPQPLAMLNRTDFMMEDVVGGGDFNTDDLITDESVSKKSKINETNMAKGRGARSKQPLITKRNEVDEDVTTDQTPVTEIENIHVIDKNLISEEVNSAVSNAMQGVMQDLVQMMKGVVKDAIKPVSDSTSACNIDVNHSDGLNSPPILSHSRVRTVSPHSDQNLMSPNRNNQDISMTNRGRDPAHVRFNRNYGPKLPPFTGDETWKVWFNRFEDVAHLKQWDDNDKVCELLPRLQGKAGEFVYDQLACEVRSDYQSLIDELGHRFRKVETARTFGAVFSNRNQKPNETVEEYAAELKRLYDRAHAKRDRLIRQEDLLRRFLDGLLNEKAKFHVEYIKEPKDIDEAVYQVVNFIEMKDRATIEKGSDKRNRKPTRAIKHDDIFVDDTDSDGDSVTLSNSDDISQKGCRVTRTGNKGPDQSPIDNKSKQDTVSNECLTEIKKLRGDMINGYEKLEDRIVKLEQSPNKPITTKKQPVTNTGNKPPNRQPNNNVCFRCGQDGHYARQCNYNVTGQFQVTPQYNQSNNYSMRQNSARPNQGFGQRQGNYQGSSQ